MSETTANLWVLDEPAPRWRRAVIPLAIGLLLGALLGSALTTLAAGPIRSALAGKPAIAAREWPKRPLDREWRSYKAPVDVNRMFRKRR
jgi:hypothetical protein